MADRKGLATMNDDKPRDVLWELARSEYVCERRTAIVSTSYFIRQGYVADTVRFAETLLSDDHEMVHRATGGCARPAKRIADGY
jgi:3-methyladenine DNA glycosylase AlkD